MCLWTQLVVHGVAVAAGVALRGDSDAGTGVVVHVVAGGVPDLAETTVVHKHTLREAAVATAIFIHILRTALSNGRSSPSHKKPRYDSKSLASF